MQSFIWRKANRDTSTARMLQIFHEEYVNKKKMNQNYLGDDKNENMRNKNMQHACRRIGTNSHKIDKWFCGNHATKFHKHMVANGICGMRAAEFEQTHKKQTNDFAATMPQNFRSTWRQNGITMESGIRNLTYQSHKTCCWCGLNTDLTTTVSLPFSFTSPLSPFSSSFVRYKR